MTDKEREELIKQMENRTQQLLESKKESKEFLYSLGMFTKNGAVKKQFRENQNP